MSFCKPENIKYLVKGFLNILVENRDNKIFYCSNNTLVDVPEELKQRCSWWPFWKSVKYSQKLSITKAIFWKLLRRGCFPGNFWYMWVVALSSESYSSRWLLWLFLVCSEEHGAFYISLLYTGMRKLLITDRLPYSSEKNYAAHPSFLKTVQFVNKFA